MCEVSLLSLDTTNGIETMSQDLQQDLSINTLCGSLSTLINP